MRANTCVTGGSSVGAGFAVSVSGVKCSVIGAGGDLETWPRDILSDMPSRKIVEVFPVADVMRYALSAFCIKLCIVFNFGFSFAGGACSSK